MEYDALRGAQWTQAFPQNSRTNPLRPPLPLIPNLKKEKNISQGDYDFYVTHYVDRPSYDGLRRKVFDTIRSANKPTLVFECPVFRQNLKKPWTSFRFGWNHYLANGEFNNRQVGNDKIEKIQLTISGIAKIPASTGISCNPSFRYSQSKVNLDTLVIGLVPTNANNIPSPSPTTPKYHFFPKTKITHRNAIKLIIQSSIVPTYK